MTALMYAARNGRALIVEKLVKHVANIDKQESRGYTVSSFITEPLFFEKKKQIEPFYIFKHDSHEHSIIEPTCAIAQWAHMHHFPSVRMSCKKKSD